jgi:hypothetical protein
VTVNVILVEPLAAQDARKIMMAFVVTAILDFLKPFLHFL